MRISVTARNDIVGGAPRPELMFARRFYRATGLDRIILVHGFRVTEEKAGEAYDAFLDKARGTGTDLGDRFYGMTWPGDNGWLANPKYFKNSEDQADICARLLADYLQAEIEDGEPLRYIFVAHSLGCRLVLQAMADLAARLPDISDRFVVFFMAAAVPGEMLAPDRAERAALQRLCRAYPLSSSRDGVLNNIFPVGRFFRSQDAVGLRSEPAGPHWTETPALTINPITEGFGHSDYWRDAAGHINDFIARKLGLGPARALPQQGLAENAITERGALDDRRIWPL